jgi:hypothetical protein
MRHGTAEAILPCTLTGLAMTRGLNEDNHPILICLKCRRQMEYLALLPEIATLPAVYAYRCLPCLRVDTVALG